MKKPFVAALCALAALSVACDASARPKKRKAAAKPPASAQAAPSSADLNKAQLQGMDPAPSAGQATTPAGAQAVPVMQAMILIRSSLSALQQANDTGDYSVLHALGSKSFQAANSPAQLAAAFAPLKPYNINSVLILEPRFTQAPVVSDQGVLSAAGVFTNDGFEISFELAYVPEDNHWKLYTLSAGLKQAAAPAS